MNDVELLQRFRSNVPGPTAEVVAVAAERLDALMADGSTSAHPAFVTTTARLGAPRTGARKFAVRLALALLVVAVLAGSAVVLVDREVDHRLGAIPTVALPPGALTPGPAVGHGPVTVLVVGSDTRSFVNDEVGAEAFGSADSAPSDRADVVVLVRIDRRGARAVWIPRDLAFTRPGETEPTKVSGVLAEGPGPMVDFVASNLGIEINHYVSTDMAGFAALVDELGGVDLSFSAPTRDEFTGLDVPAGCTRLDGDAALALVRSRHAETLVDGNWLLVDGAAPDLSRIANQQTVLGAIRTETERRVGDHPVAAFKLLDRLLNNMTVDDSFSRRDLRAIASTLLRDGAETTMSTLPVQPSTDAPAALAAIPGVSVPDLLRARPVAVPAPSPVDSNAFPADPPVVGPC